MAQFTNTNLPKFEKIEKVKQSGKFWQGDWKIMKKWPILRKILKNYENLVTCDKETEKVWKSGLWGSRRFYLGSEIHNCPNVLYSQKFKDLTMCHIR